MGVKCDKTVMNSEECPVCGKESINDSVDDGMRVLVMSMMTMSMSWEEHKSRSQAGTSLAVQWLRLCLPMQGLWVRSLVGKLRSHMPCGQKPKT